MHSKTISADLLQSKQHFAVLDGLRGVAALAVVVFHFMEFVASDPAHNFIGHGFLAVDFFFCLSGFVIGYAYDSRIGKMGMLEFFKSRLIRLHPLIIIGTILCLLTYWIDPFTTYSGMYGARELALIVICSLLLIPYPVMEPRYFNLFGLNAPSWSLFWEYIANVVYALVLCRISRKLLAVLTALAAVAIFILCFNVGNLVGGWGKDTFWHGAVRVSFSFMAGLLIYRSGWIIKNRIGFFGLGLMLLVAFVMPYGKWNWVLEPLAVIVYFPLLVALGAGTITGERTRKVCELSGNLSYPLYMTHYAAIWLFGSYMVNLKMQGPLLVAIIVGGTIALAGFAYLILITCDMPVRKYLSSLRQRKRS